MQIFILLPQFIKDFERGIHFKMRPPQRLIILITLKTLASKFLYISTSTCLVFHITNAIFIIHTLHRTQENKIAKQYIDN